MWRFKINPSKPVKYVKGLRASLQSIDAKQRNQHSWVAKTADYFVFTVEIDHLDKDRNQYDHFDGVLIRDVAPLSRDNGDSAMNVAHGTELFEALTSVYSANEKCRLVLIKGSKNGKTTGGVKAAVDSDYWQVEELSGSVEEGFKFTLNRVG